MSRLDGQKVVNAKTIKNHLLHYYRFDRGFYYLATEWMDCDLVVFDHRTNVLVEIEVKMSWDDYKADFSKRKYQYSGERYEGYRLGQGVSPHLKYFAAPDTLAIRILGNIVEKSLPFGVIRVSDQGPFVTIARRAKRLRFGGVDENAIRSIISRMSSELVTLRRQVRS